MTAMTLREAFRTLKLSDGAAMEDVKRSFRKLAFELHPDLNPDDQAAHRNFQRLNEAYVMVRAHLNSKDTGAKAEAREQPRADAKAGAGAYERQKRAARPGASQHGNRARAGAGPYFHKKEEVLRDILKDPFARQVFEDIYSEIKKGGAAGKKARERTLDVNWGDKRVTLDMSKGVWSGIKGWFRSHLDDEQTVHFPRHALLPGRAVRISVHQRFSKHPKTIEITLPKDFIIGRPIRLKDLGRRIGPLRGDLYLRIMGK